MTPREEIVDIHARLADLFGNLADLHARLAVLYHEAAGPPPPGPRHPPPPPGPRHPPPPRSPSPPTAEHDEPADVQAGDDGMDGKAYLDHLKALPDFEQRRRKAQSIAKSAGFGWQPWLWTTKEVAVIRRAMDVKMPATRRQGARR